MPPLRIMVIDDNADTIELMVDFLTAYGYEVITWHTSAQAVEQVQQHQPHVVVLDHRLNTLTNGWEILVALRAEPTTAHIPVLLYSAEHMVLREYRDLVRTSRGDVLKKPFLPEELLVKIEALTNTATQ